MDLDCPLRTGGSFGAGVLADLTVCRDETESYLGTLPDQITIIPFVNTEFWSAFILHET